MEVDDVLREVLDATLDDDRSYAAVVIATPQGKTGVWVTIGELGQAQHGPCKYQPVIGHVPTVGDRCLVARANGRDDWWIVQFDGEDASGQTVVDALTARLAALEALGLTKRTRGVANVSTAASVSGTAVVAHGLGVTPSVVLGTAQNSTAGLAVVTVASITSTDFVLGVRYSDGVSRTLSNPIGWEAIA